MRRYLIAISALVLLAAPVIGGWQARDVRMPQVTLPPSGSGVVTGEILSETTDSKPIRRATVRLSQEAVGLARTVGSDDRGRFAFEQLPAGRYTLSVTRPGFVQAFHGSSRPGIGPGVPLSVTEGSTVTVSMRLLPAASISGTITDPSGNPAPGVTVAAVETRSAVTTPRPMSAITDDRGVYRISGLVPGQYVVSALPRLYAAPDGGRGNAAIPVIPTTEADLRWARSGAAASSAPAPARPVVYAPVFYPGTTNAAAAGTVRVVVGEERDGVNLSLQIAQMSRLSGTIVDMNGQPITAAQLTLAPRRGDRPSPVDALTASGALALPRAIVTSEGFVFTSVAPGDYTLIARSGSGGRGMVTDAPAAPAQWSVTDVTVAGDRGDLAVRLSAGLVLSGTLVFDQSTAVTPKNPSAIEILLEASNPLPGLAASTRAIVNADGSFVFRSIPPGAYMLRAVVPASLTEPAGARWSLKSAAAGDREFADRPLLVSSGAPDITRAVITLTDRAAEVSGRLIDASSQPVTRYSIVLFTQTRSLWMRGSRRIMSARPATDGTFTLEGLPAGDYAIAAVEDLDDADLGDPDFLARLLAGSVKVTLADGERKKQDLRIGR